MTVIADSFLLRDGTLIRPDLHRRRFYRDAVWAGAEPAAIEEFFAEVGPELGDAAGEWFPKLTWEGDKSGGEFSLHMRPAPALREETTLAFVGAGDPRAHPTVKGPDLGRLSELRQRAQSMGADDAVITRGGQQTSAHRDGEAAVVEAAVVETAVVETANAALVFFIGNELLIAPRDMILPSVTWQATVDEVGIAKRVREGALTVREALRTPAWCGSALHGWTPVTGWVLESGERNAAAPAPAGCEDINRRLWARAEKWER